MADTPKRIKRLDAGLIHDIPPAAEIVERIVAEAEGLLKDRRPAPGVPHRVLILRPGHEDYYFEVIVPGDSPATRSPTPSSAIPRTSRSRSASRPSSSAR